ncbi:MAG: hypothetical protein HYV08_15675 [Deltaproteobacteria bacterium]|nr:hypothetical protein [Deltaproteobacteria bacterium]
MATAFSAGAVAETLLTLEGEMKAADPVRSALARAGAWLLRRTDAQVLNQVAGAASALAALARLTGEARFAAGARAKLRELEGAQSPEGWFPEYGGPDVGYLSVTVEHLVKVHEHLGEPLALALAERACGFLAYTLQPDGGAGGCVGSRNTQYLLPHGVERLAPGFPAARVLAEAIRRGMEAGRAVVPAAVDDKYLAFYSASLLLAARDASPDLDTGTDKRAGGSALTSGSPADHLVRPGEPVRTSWFPEAGWWIAETPMLHLIAAARKGGAFRAVFRATGTVLEDGGVWIARERGRPLTSAWLVSSRPPNVGQALTSEDGRLQLQGPLWAVGPPIMSPGRFAALRIVQHALGRWEPVARWVKARLRQRVIHGARLRREQFYREVWVEGEALTILDEVELPPGAVELLTGAPLPAIYGESSRYYAGRQLPAIQLRREEWPPGRRLRLIRTYSATGALLGLEVMAG